MKNILPGLQGGLTPTEKATLEEWARAVREPVQPPPPVTPPGAGNGHGPPPPSSPPPGSDPFPPGGAQPPTAPPVKTPPTAPPATPPPTRTPAPPAPPAQQPAGPALSPRSDEERENVLAAGYDLDKVIHTDDLVSGDNCFFAATGVTDGELLRGVHYSRQGASTSSLVMRSRSGTVRRIEARHQLAKLREFASVSYE